MLAIALGAIAACSGGSAPTNGGVSRSIAAFPQRRFGDPIGSASGLSLWTENERNALFDLAESLSIPVDSLGVVMAIESGFNPAAINPGKTKAAGLIQLTTGARLPGFETPTAIATVATWDVERQLREVVRPYYERVGGARGADAGTLYMLNLLPVHAFQPSDTVIARKLDAASLSAILASLPAMRSADEQAALRLHFIYEQNSGFDRLHRGFFTVGDVKAFANGVLGSAAGRRMVADGTILSAV